MSYHIITVYTFNKHFTGQFTHNKFASVPWKCLSSDLNYEYILSESLPEDTFLMDPSKFQQSDIDGFWRHWVERQKVNSQGLVFSKAAPRHMREPKHQPAPALGPNPTAGCKEKDNNVVDFFVDDVNKEASGSSHPDSPAAHAKSVESKMAFLFGLSEDLNYNKFVRLLESRERASVPFSVVTLHLTATFTISSKLMAFLPSISLPGVAGSGR